jgi:hypothetical protein
MEATVGKKVDEAMSAWAKRLDVKDLSQLSEAILALNLEPAEARVRHEEIHRIV